MSNVYRLVNSQRRGRFSSWKKIMHIYRELSHSCGRECLREEVQQRRSWKEIKSLGVGMTSPCPCATASSTYSDRRRTQAMRCDAHEKRFIVLRLEALMRVDFFESIMYSNKDACIIRCVDHLVLRERPLLPIRKLESLVQWLPK